MDNENGRAAEREFITKRLCWMEEKASSFCALKVSALKAFQNRVMAK